MPYPSIVTLNVSTLLASTPANRQQTGALISQGGTTLASGTSSLLTSAASLTSLLAAPLALSSLTWSGGTVTATAAAALVGLSTGDTFITKIAGATPAAYNGTYLATVTGSTTFTYAVATNPGTETVAGTFTGSNQQELVAMATTYFAQNTGVGVYVLELGAGDGNSGPTALGTFITANPGAFYSFLVPRSWDGTANFLSLISQYEADNSMTYFFTTTTTNTYTDYTSSMKSVYAQVEAPSLSLSEFTLAADFARTLSYLPSNASMMLPTVDGYVYGVTKYPAAGNSAIMDSLLAANVNFIGDGSEGGLSNSIIFGGTTLDGEDFSWWFEADWVQIQGNQALASAVIQGNNNKANPLYYNQNGINRLQAVVMGVMQSGISYGVLNGTLVQTALDPTTFNQNLQNGVYAGMNVVNAVPFPIYTQLNPNDYGNRVYNGFSVVALPMNGFRNIVVNLLVSNLIGSV